MKIKVLQPLWYHPFNVMLLDDDKNLLNSLVTEIDPSFPPLVFTNPEKALEHLKKNALPLEKLSQEIISDIEPSEKKHLSTENVAIDFSPLHAELDKSTRFTRILVAVVDRAMNEMDGLDFCRKIKELGLPVKLILLTGHTSTDEAVAAFNNGIIDAFVQKSTDFAAMAEKLNPYIKKLAFQAFCDSSVQLLGPILNRLHFLTNKTHVVFLEKLLQKYEASEYYVIDSTGSYLLITSKGVMKILLMKTDDDFQDAHDIATSDESNSDILKDLENRRAFPFTGTKQSHFNFDITQWKKAMVPMQKQEDLNLYYGIAEVSEKVMSFDYYVHKLWKPEVN